VSDVNLEAIRLARQVFAKMHWRDATIADAEALTTLAIVLDSAEVTAHEMHDRGVTEEREACAAIADEEPHNPNCPGGSATSARIRARGTK